MRIGEDGLAAFAPEIHVAARDDHEGRRLFGWQRARQGGQSRR